MRGGDGEAAWSGCTLAGTVDDSDGTEQKLTAIRKAGAGELTVPEHAHALVEEALRAGATVEQIREATDQNPYWPFS